MQEFVPFCLLRLPFPTPERPGLLWIPSARWKLFCPVQAQGHTVVSSPPLTSHKLPSESIAWGTVCAVDSPALTFLPLKQALGWDLGCSPLFLPKSNPPPPNFPHHPYPGSFCGTYILLFLELSLRLSRD